MPLALGGITHSQAQGMENAKRRKLVDGKKHLTQPTVTGASSQEKAAEWRRSMAGAIKHIELVNFMNHAHLQVDLKPGVNFIFGKNGSGKSALLAGCMVGLGMRAAAVGRSGKASGLVQEGKESAMVKLVLHNVGDNAYQPEVYGREIIIERWVGRITKHLARDQGGAVVASKSAEIAEICDCLNVHVGNPCVVLTQEKARKFLATTDDEARYRFFMEAAQLDVTKQHLEEMQHDMVRMEENIKACEGEVDAHRDVVARHKENYDKAVELAAIDGKIADLEVQRHWVRVREAKGAVAVQSGAVDKLEAGLAAAKESVAKLHADAEATAEEHSRYEEETTPAQERLKELGDEAHRLTEEVSKLKRERKTAHTKASSEEECARRLRTSAKAKRDRAEKERSERSKKAEAAERSRAAERERLVGQKKAAETRRAAVLQELEGMEEQSASAQEVAAKRREHERSLNMEVREAEKHVKQLSAGGGAHTGALQFGPEHPEILKLIEENAARFRQTPVGPVGMFIKLKDPTWNTAVTTSCGATLQHYVVGSQADRQALADLCKRSRLRVPEVVVMPFDDREYAIDETKMPERREGYVRMLDVITFTHPMAQQVTVDKAHVERNILIADQSTAKLHVYERPPRSVGRAYGKDGTCWYKKGGVEAQERATQRARPIRLGSDVYEQLSQWKALLAERTDALRELQRESRESVDVAASLHARKAALDSEAKSLQRRVRAVEDALAQLALQATTDEDATAALAADADDDEANAATHAQQAELLRDRVKDIDGRLAPLQAKSAETKAAMERLLQDQKEVYDAARDAKVNLVKARKRVEEGRRKIKEMETTRGEALSKLQKLKRTADSLERSAQEKLPAGQDVPDVGRLTEGAPEAMPSG